MKKFGVVVIERATGERWAESTWPTLGEAEDRRKYLEAAMVGATIEVCDWTDYNLKEEDKVMKYKQLKPISLASVYDALPEDCADARGEFNKFCKWTSYEANVGNFFGAIDFDRIISTFDNHSAWRSFFIAEGFIEEEIKTYHIRQDFKLKSGVVYKLIQPEYRLISLINLTNANAWHWPLTLVKDEEKITQKEFDIITNCQSKDFTLIK